MEQKITEAVQQKKGFVYGLEHELVYTAGLKTAPEHILQTINFVKTRRGGSITVHNPGQLILYTVLPLGEINNNLERYIRVLEVCIMNVLSSYGITSFQHDEHTGVWTKRGKIAFIGISAKKGAIYHGAALNVNNDLNDYKPILSCGLDLPITRMIDEPELNTTYLSLSEISKMWFDTYEKIMQQEF
ncbi:MAG: lipoyl(octanoyl) transferase LipB [Spirochaetia bacterium]|nr:lipoyl(octanoyl) transferase LipB [Spirochaetia bacterium]